METAVKEDRWVLSETITEKRSSMTKQESRLAELLTLPRGKTLPISSLVSTPEYQVRRRLSSSKCLKEIQWMGESFALKHVFGEVEQAMQEISLLSSLSHPNVMHYMFLFSDEEKKECLIVMELMNKDLISYINEISCSRRKVPFPLLAAVDVMLQIARGMEYLHSRKIYHGDLNPSNILVQTKNSTPDGYVQVKITGMGKSAVSGTTPKGPTSPGAGANPSIWYAPEVLAEQEQSLAAEAGNAKRYSEKSDVYSFAMICFELLTGKVPFEDSHMQGDKMSRNIRTGERPLFPFPSSKLLTNLTKRCWQADPNQRPTFSSICRMLRYIKRFLIMNPENGRADDSPLPPLDYFDIEMSLSRKFASWQKRDVLHVSDIPFEMYAYRMMERERISANIKEKSSDSSSDASISGEENGFQATVAEDVMSISRMSSSSGSGKSSNATYNGFKNSIVRKVETKPQSSAKLIGSYNLKLKMESPPHRLLSNGRGVRLKADSPIRRAKTVVMSPLRRRSSGHASDSEL